MNVQKPSVKANFDLANVTLENAIEDLKVSRLLFQNMHYARSIFHLQQSIEKSVKSYGYYFGLFDEDIAKKSRHIGHNTIQAYPVSLEQYQKIVDYIKSEQNSDIQLQLLFEKIPFFTEIENNVDSALDEFKKWSQFSMDDNHSSEKITEYVNFLQTRSTEAEIVLKLLKNKKFSKEIKDFMCTESKKTVVQQIHFFCKKSHKPFPPMKKKIEECFELFTQKKSDHLLLFAFYQRYSMEPLLYLGLITQNHEQKTRYPDSKDSFNPLSFYDGQNPLVQNYQKITNFTNLSVKNLKKLYSMEIPSKETIFRNFKV
jgi:hypothetical protein